MQQAPPPPPLQSSTSSSPARVSYFISRRTTVALVIPAQPCVSVESHVARRTPHSIVRVFTILYYINITIINDDDGDIVRSNPCFIPFRVFPHFRPHASVARFRDPHFGHVPVLRRAYENITKTNRIHYLGACVCVCVHTHVSRLKRHATKTAAIVQRNRQTDRPTDRHRPIGGARQYDTQVSFRECPVTDYYDCDR